MSSNEELKWTVIAILLMAVPLGSMMILSELTKYNPRNPSIDLIH